MEEVRTRYSGSGGSTKTATKLGYLENQVNSHSKILELILTLIIASIFLITIDLIKDRNTQDTASSIDKSLNAKINEIKEELMKYKNDDIKNDIILNCLKVSKYWEYSKCFTIVE